MAEERLRITALDGGCKRSTESFCFQNSLLGVKVSPELLPATFSVKWNLTVSENRYAKVRFGW